MGRAGTRAFNLGPRLTLTFVSLIVLILGGNALVISQFETIRNETDRLTGANQQLIAVLRLQANVLSFHRRLDDLARSMDVNRLVTGAESLRVTLREQTQQTRTAIAKLPSGTFVNPLFLPTLDTIDVALPGEIDAIVELAKSGDWGAIQARVADELSPNEDQSAILVDSINRQASGELAREVAERQSVQRRILIIVPAIALCTFFIATFFGWSIARRFIEMRLEERVSERTRIARELHDTILQSFQGVMMKFQSLTYILDRPAEAREKLEGLLEQGDEAIKEGRNAVRGMRASTVVKNDLAHALATVGERLAGDSPVDFHVVVEGRSRDLRPILRDEVYRIASEATCNAFRHSGAGQIEIEICYDKKRLRVRVRDNGKGIDAKVLECGGREGHYGLPGMQERARLAGGKLTVLSRLDSGTEVELTLPAFLAYAKSSAPSRSIA
jgi:signal transduction histidine kinase